MLIFYRVWFEEECTIHEQNQDTSKTTCYEAGARAEAQMRLVRTVVATKVSP
jgi:hypothetical protein